MLQVNETEIPLLHEFNDAANEKGGSLEVCFRSGKLFVYFFLYVI